jgi:hypothetical protein
MDESKFADVVKLVVCLLYLLFCALFALVGLFTWITS